MTDEQIEKALKCCVDGVCEDCPCFGGACVVGGGYALALIQRQKDEIERLTSENEDLLGKCGELGARIMMLKAQLAAARADAVRVFADTVIERIVRKKAETSDYWQNDVKRYRAMQGYADIEHEADNFLRGYNESVDDILALLDSAEMTEGKNED